MPITIHTTTLKYKTENGFQSADTIKGTKGDKGDAYVLTQSDKTDIAASVDHSDFIEQVSGTAVTIDGRPNMRYVCGEVASISIIPPADGSIEVLFTSGTTAAVLTLPSTVRMPEWWGGIEENYTYDLIIIDGTYGAVMSWPT